jgi:hypothetical protein
MEKKYKVIAKVGNNENGTAKCVKYNVNDLVKFSQFLDKQFPTWRWFNVYSKETKVQIGSFTKFNRPHSKFVK